MYFTNFSSSLLVRKSRGFTLVELLVTLAIIAILAAIALPSYSAYIIRASRTAAQAEMMEIANRQQQYFFANRGYADKTKLEDNGYALPSKVSERYSYDIALGNGAMPSYVINFTAIDRQLSDGDLSLTSEGVKTPANKW